MSAQHTVVIIIIIIIISIFKEDNVYSMTANLPYGPPVNTDIDYYRTLFYSDFFFVSVAMLVLRYLLGKDYTSQCLSYSAEHQAR